MNNFLRLDLQVFQASGFLNTFRSSLNPQTFVGKSRTYNEFTSNHSAVAHWNKLLQIYEEHDDPENYLKTHKLSFHWADWVDTAPANAFIDSYESLLKEFDNDPDELAHVVKKYCINNFSDGDDRPNNNLYAKERLKIFEQLEDVGYCAAIYMYYYQELPRNVVFETDFEYFSWPVKNEVAPRPHTLDEFASLYYDQEEISKPQVKEFAIKSSSELIKYPQKMREVFQAKGKEIKKISLKEYIDIPKNHFDKPNVGQIIKDLESQKSLTEEQQRELDFVKYSKAQLPNAHRFYWLFPFFGYDKIDEFHHYTFPFVKQMILSKERSTMVHHLGRSWFKFTEYAGVVSWFGYGNLIGWYRHSRNLPWDPDIDVVLSIKDLTKKSKKFNASLVVENPENGHNLFYFQTTPYFYQHRDNQMIDARYIDVRTGIYIDISCLWNDNDRDIPDRFKNEAPETIYHCKNYNWFSHRELFPLRRTLYEGAQAYAPNDYKAILLAKYGEKSMTATNNFGHNWQPDIGVWVPNEICDEKTVPAKEKRFDKNGELTLTGACNDTNILEEWSRFRDLYTIHNKEQKLLEKGKDASELSKEDLPVARYFDRTKYM